MQGYIYILPSRSS